jgi:hypothetical protein
MEARIELPLDVARLVISALPALKRLSLVHKLGKEAHNMFYEHVRLRGWVREAISELEGEKKSFITAVAHLALMVRHSSAIVWHVAELLLEEGITPPTCLQHVAERGPTLLVPINQLPGWRWPEGLSEVGDERVRGKGPLVRWPVQSRCTAETLAFGIRATSVCTALGLDYLLLVAKLDGQVDEEENQSIRERIPEAKRRWDRA